MIRSEDEIRSKIQDSMKALEDFVNKEESTPEEFFVVARQATFLTALYWVLNEEVPQSVTSLAVPILKRMAQVQSEDVKKQNN